MVKFNDEIAKHFNPEVLTKKGKVDYKQIVLDFDKSGKVKTGIEREASDPRLNTMVVSLRQAITALEAENKIENVAIHVQSHKGDTVSKSRTVGKEGKAVRVVDAIILYKKTETETQTEASKVKGKKAGRV